MIVMETTDIRIKGMVCERCILVIRQGLEAMGFRIREISLGRVSFFNTLLPDQMKQVEHFLAENGFELLSTRESKVTDRVKKIIEELFADSNAFDHKIKFSSLLQKELMMNYDSISQIFSSMEGLSLEKYIIVRRLEKVKELLVYTDLTLTEIAARNGFSSINHLSRQFKEMTGFPPSHFRAVSRQKQQVSSSESNIQ
jgi:AraC family transcriptional regulator